MMRPNSVPDQAEVTAELEIYLGLGAPTEIPTALQAERRTQNPAGTFWRGIILRPVGWIR